MAPKQRMRIANEKASKWVTMRGNVPKSSVSWNAIFSWSNASKWFACEKKIKSKINWKSSSACKKKKKISELCETRSRLVNIRDHVCLCVSVNACVSHFISFWLCIRRKQKTSNGNNSKRFIGNANKNAYMCVREHPFTRTHTRILSRQERERDFYSFFRLSLQIAKIFFWFACHLRRMHTKSPAMSCMGESTIRINVGTHQYGRIQFLPTVCIYFFFFCLSLFSLWVRNVFIDTIDPDPNQNEMQSSKENWMKWCAISFATWHILVLFWSIEWKRYAVLECPRDKFTAHIHQSQCIKQLLIAVSTVARPGTHTRVPLYFENTEKYLCVRVCPKSLSNGEWLFFFSAKNQNANCWRSSGWKQ